MSASDWFWTVTRVLAAAYFVVVVAAEAGAFVAFAVGVLFISMYLMGCEHKARQYEQGRVRPHMPRP